MEALIDFSDKRMLSQQLSLDHDGEQQTEASFRVRKISFRSINRGTFFAPFSIFLSMKIASAPISNTKAAGRFQLQDGFNGGKQLEAGRCGGGEIHRCFNR